MAQLGTKFNATEHDTEQRDYEDLPNGIYQLEIEASDIVVTGPESDPTGSGMKYTANVLAPTDVEGRKFFGFINLENRNPQAQEIGQRELASLCRALEMEGVEDTEELHLKAYTVKIGMGKPSKKKNEDGTPMYPARAEIKKYFFPDQGNVPEPSVDDSQPAAPANDNKKPAASKAKTAAGAAGKKRPWG